MQSPSRQPICPRVCLFEDRGVATLEPVALTRPAFDLLCGATSLGRKQLLAFAAAAAGALVRPQLAELCRLQHPNLAVNDPDWLASGPVVLVNARWLPPAAFDPPGPGPCVGLAGDEVAYAVVDPQGLGGHAWHSLDADLQHWRTVLPPRPAGGRLIRHLWELVHLNGEELCREFASATAVVGPGTLPPLAVAGPPERLLVHPSARIEPMVVADTTDGPVVIEAGAVVTAFTRLEGPCHVGPHTHLLGAKVRAGTTLGPHCRIGGEVEASIVQGYSNKYHDGFLGHSYIGEWVNLGAGTCNSDLRNDYGEVAVTVAGRRTPTGLTKVGCFLGDHTKTGLGTLLNTGTNAGAFCNLLPSGGFLPKYLPSFGSWWNGLFADKADLENLLKTAARVMGRRGVDFTEAHAALYERLFEETAAERRRVVRDAEQKRLRRSA
jgi:UDP-N-acetylglucosamine diphosphorylase/glucosamine-1-phosphate N-acetyltransferase